MRMPEADGMAIGYKQHVLLPIEITPRDPARPVVLKLALEAAEGVRPYKVAGSHRHTAEIEQELAAVAGRDLRLTFTPHLLPMARGILSCVYATPTDPARPAAASSDMTQSTHNPLKRSKNTDNAARRKGLPRPASW